MIRPYMDYQRRRVYFGTRIHAFRIHHGAVGVGCVVAGHQLHNRVASTAMIVAGAVLMWDDLPDFRKSWWLRDV